MAAVEDMYLLKDDVKVEAKREEIRQMLIESGEDPSDFNIDALAEDTEF